MTAGPPCTSTCRRTRNRQHDPRAPARPGAAAPRTHVFDSRADAQASAEAADGATVTLWARLAADHGVVIVGGFCGTTAAGELFNSAAAGPGTSAAPMSYWADSAFLAAAGIPTVLYGPEGDGAAGLTGVEYLDPDQVREIVPAAAGPFLGALWSPVDAQCQPEAGTGLFVRRAEHAGTRFAYGVKATRLLESRGRITGVQTTRGRVGTGTVVVAAGVWTAHLLATVGITVPLMPVCLSEGQTEALAPLFRPAVRSFGFGAGSGRTAASWSAADSAPG